MKHLNDLLHTLRLCLQPTRRQVAIYLLAACGLSACQMYYAGKGLAFLITPLTAAAIYLMTAFSPLVFANDNGRIIMTMLPTPRAYKVAAVLLYTFLVIPAITIAPYALGFQLMPDSEQSDALLNAARAYLAANAGILALATAVPPAVCLAAVLSYRKKTAIRAGLITIGSIIAIILAGIVHFVLILKGLYTLKVIGHSEYSVNSNSQIFNDTADVIRGYPALIGDSSSFGAAEIAVLGVVLAALLLSICVKFKNRQL